MTTQGNYSERDAAHLIQQVIDGVAYLHHKGTCCSRCCGPCMIFQTRQPDGARDATAGIVHRDLKLENILLLNHDHDAPIKIADFGLSKNLAPNDVLSTMCGSPQYVAPEILEMGSGTSEQYSPACDMWSIGVILFILLSGYSPFGAVYVATDVIMQRNVDRRREADCTWWHCFADDDVDAVLFRKIKSGKYDADDPIWEGISGPAKDLVVRVPSKVWGTTHEQSPKTNKNPCCNRPTYW